MKTINYFLLIVFILISPFFVYAQIKVKGKVVEVSQEPIEFANIVLLDSRDSILAGTMTDSFGLFNLDYTEKGDFRIRITYVGYDEFTKKINNSIDLQTITLLPTKLDEIIITGQQTINLKKKDGKYLINVKNTTFTNSENVLEGLKQIPLLNINNNSIKINNKNAIIEINGTKTQITGDNLQDYLKSLSPYSIKSIEINSNPNASYGTKVDAVINIITSNKINNYRVSLKTSNGQHSQFFNTENVNYSLNLKKISIFTNYSYSYFPKSNTSNIGQEINNIKSAYDYQENVIDKSHNYLISLGINLNSKNTFDFTQFYSQNRSKTFGKAYNITQQEQILLDAENRTMQLAQTWKRKISNQSSYKLGLYEVFKKFNTSNMARTNNQLQLEQTIKTKIPILVAFFDYSHAKKNRELSFGIKYNNVSVSNNNFTVLSNKNFNSPYNYNEKVASVYINQSIDFSNSKFLSIGIRTESSFVNYKYSNYLVNQSILKKINYTNILYNISYDWQSSKKWNNSVAFRKQIIRPNYTYLNPFKTINSDITLFSGNAEINPTKHYSISFENSRKKIFLFSQVGIMKDFISTLSLLDSNKIVQTYRNFNCVLYSSIGIQAFFSRKKWRTKTGLNLSYYSLKDSSFIGIKRSTPSIFFNSNHSIRMRHKFFISINYELEPPYFDGLVNHYLSHKFDFTLSKRINQLSIYLYVKDLFKTNYISEKTTFPNFSYSSKYYDDVRSIGLIIRWSITGKTYKKRNFEKPIDDSIDRLEK